MAEAKMGQVQLKVMQLLRKLKRVSSSSINRLANGEVKCTGVRADQLLVCCKPFDRPLEISAVLSYEVRRMPDSGSNSSKLSGNGNASQAPADSPQGTTLPRHIAGVLDNLLAWFLAIVCAKQVPDTQIALQILAAVLAYLGYFLVFESLFCTTPAKFMNGLVVRDFNGGRCSFRQTLIRTLFRLLEVNPALLGFLPAAASIIWSRHKQRFGDKVARTVVVPR